MEVRFTTKEASNRERERAFLALAPVERFAEFLHLSRRIEREYPSSRPREYGANLVLERGKPPVNGLNPPAVGVREHGVE